MAAISKSGNPVFDGAYAPFPPGLGPVDVTSRGAFRLGPFYAGEALAPGDACQISSAGTVMRSVGTSAGGARIHGYCVSGAASGAATYLHMDVVLTYGASLTPGIPVYLSATAAGALDTAPSTNCTQPIGFSIDDKRVFLFQSHY